LQAKVEDVGEMVVQQVNHRPPGFLRKIVPGLV